MPWFFAHLADVSPDWNNPLTWTAGGILTIMTGFIGWLWKQKQDADRKREEADQKRRDEQQKAEEKRQDDARLSAKIRQDEMAVINTNWRQIYEEVKKEYSVLQGQISGLQGQLMAMHEAHAKCVERAAAQEVRLLEGDKERDKLRIKDTEQQKQIDELMKKVAELLRGIVKAGP